MGFQEFYTLFTEQIQNTPIIEWIAVVFAVAEVLLAKKNSLLLYPAGIVSTTLFIYIMADAGLYAESLLSGYYLIMSVYGWLHWVRGKNKPDLPVTFNTKKDWSITFAIVAIGWLILYLVLNQYTDSTVPAWDAWITSTAWVGMWLLARRKVENWLLLNLSNLFAIPLQVIKGIPLTACLTLILFIVAIFGYFDWRRIAQKQAKIEH